MAVASLRRRHCRMIVDMHCRVLWSQIGECFQEIRRPGHVCQQSKVSFFGRGSPRNVASDGATYLRG